MPLVPIDFSKKGMVNSIYEDDYYYEHLQNVVDNLNLQRRIKELEAELIIANNERKIG
jgi:hypothetical protein